MTQSLLSFEEYSTWCMSSKPAFDPGNYPMSLADTVAPDSNETCPVTVRSEPDSVVVTPRPQRSR